MADNFEAALRHVLAYEGGYSDHPNDPGGATNYGITIGVLKEWLGREVTARDVKAITPEVAKAIYRAKYWNAVRCDELPSGIDFIVFDCAVNQGIGRASKFLQTAAGSVVDGVIGPKTLAAVRAKNQADLLVEFCARRAVSYGNLQQLFRTFGLGWSRRLMHASSAAQTMLAPPKDGTQLALPSPSQSTPSTPPQPLERIEPMQQSPLNSPPAPVGMTIIDSLIGGGLLVGQKTIIGIVGYVLVVAMHNLGLQPAFMTPEIYELAYTLFAGLAGLGFVSKFERYARLFGWTAGKAGALPQTTTNTAAFDPFAPRG